ncbi:MAG: hypothetical protein GY910_09215 [bacterium]|nr:hypothetical protein [bacterium]
MSGSTHRVPPNSLSRVVLETQDLCTFNWSTQEGWPMGTTVAFQWIDEKLWFSMDRSEARVRAIRRDPRVSLVLRTGGQSVTVKGRVAFSEDLEVKRLVYRTTGDKVARLTGGDSSGESYAQYLEGKGSVVLEVIPEKWIAYDGSDGSLSTSPPSIS